MSGDMFLKLEGIDGESVDHAHTDEIDVLSWNWAMSQSGSFHVGGGGGAGKAAFQDVNVTKWVDKSTATLMLKIATGEHIPSGTLTVRKAGKKPLEYLVLKMEKIMITSLSTGASGGEDRLTENITLNCASVAVAYTPQKEDGSGDAAVEFGFDISKNETK